MIACFFQIELHAPIIPKHVYFVSTKLRGERGDLKPEVAAPRCTDESNIGFGLAVLGMLPPQVILSLDFVRDEHVIRMFLVIGEAMFSIAFHMEMIMTFSAECGEEDGLILLKGLRGNREQLMIEASTPIGKLRQFPWNELVQSSW